MLTQLYGNLLLQSDDPKMVKTLFAPEGNGNERNLVVGWVAVVGSSLCRLVPRMSQLTLGVAVAQSETRSSPPSPSYMAIYCCNQNSIWSNNQRSTDQCWGWIPKRFVPYQAPPLDPYQLSDKAQNPVPLVTRPPSPDPSGGDDMYVPDPTAGMRRQLSPNHSGNDQVTTLPPCSGFYQPNPAYQDPN